MVQNNLHESHLDVCVCVSLGGSFSFPWIAVAGAKPLSLLHEWERKSVREIEPAIPLRCWSRDYVQQLNLPRGLGLMNWLRVWYTPLGRGGCCTPLCCKLVHDWLFKVITEDKKPCSKSELSFSLLVTSFLWSTFLSLSLSFFLVLYHHFSWLELLPIYLSLGFMICQQSLLFNTLFDHRSAISYIATHAL